MMLHATSRFTLLALLGLVLTACNQEAPEQKIPPQPASTQAETAQAVVTSGGSVQPDVSSVNNTAANNSPVQVLEWEDLVPKDWNPNALLKDFDVDSIEDGTDKAKEFETKLKEIWDNAPARKDLENKIVKLPGFVVPLETDGKVITEFLLVPYQGACIHTPPPPANQTVYVKTGPTDAKIRHLFDTVWVTGKLTIEKVNSELAIAGYTLLASKVEPFE